LQVRELQKQKEKNPFMYKRVLFALDMYVNERYFIRTSDPALTSRPSFLIVYQLNGRATIHAAAKDGFLVLTGAAVARL
jgi:hypothetical protein